MKRTPKLASFPTAAVVGVFLCSALWIPSLNAQAVRQVASKAPHVIEPYLENADPNLLRSYADECLSAGDPDKAVVYARRAVVLQPGNATNHATLAQALTEKFHKDGSSNADLHHEAVHEWKYVITNGDSFESDDALQQLSELGLEKVKLLVKPKDRSRSVTGKIVPPPKHSDQ